MGDVLLHFLPSVPLQRYLAWRAVDEADMRRTLGDSLRALEATPEHQFSRIVDGAEEDTSKAACEAELRYWVGRLGPSYEIEAERLDPAGAPPSWRNG